MAGRIPSSFIDDLINRVDIVEVIDARVPLKKAGREYTACCPFHNEKTPSFTVSPTKQFYHCFGCGAHGTAVGFLMEYEHMEFVEAIEELAHLVGVDIPYEQTAGPQDKVKRQHKTDWYTLLEQCDRFYRKQLRQHTQAARAVAYLKERGLSGEVAAEYGIGFAPPGWDNILKAFGQTSQQQKDLATVGMLIEKDEGGYYDRFRDRIIFPIRDSRGRTVGFGGRVINPDDSPKYLNSPETPLFHKGRELYGLYEARKVLRDIPRLLVVEGYMDVVSLAQFNIHYAVATLGTATTADHLNRLFRVSNEVVFCFDGDRAGREAAWRALQNALPVMRDGHTIRFMFLPEGEDPDTLVRCIGKEAFEGRLDQAMPLSEYLFEHLQSQTDMKSLDGRARLVDLAKPLVEKLPPGAFRQLVLGQLAELAKLELMAAESLLGVKGGSSPTSRSRKTSVTPKKTPSTVRVILERVLHDPSLASEAGDPRRFINFLQPGINLLVQVLETMQKNPTLKTAAVLERWRDTEEGKHLQKLAAWQPQLDDRASLREEFLGALARLEDQHRDTRTDALLDKANKVGLTSAEKEELKALLHR